VDATKGVDVSLKGFRGWVGGYLCGLAAVLVLIGLNVARHPDGLADGGRGLLIMDVALLLMMGLIAVALARWRTGKFVEAVKVGGGAGLVLGLVAMANHSVELFATERSGAVLFLSSAGPVLAMFGLFALAGAMGRERTGLIAFGVVAGECAAMVAVVVLLGFAFGCNLIFQTKAEHGLRGALVASGMSDAGAFCCRIRCRRRRSF
jgi:hypothetical protein